MMQSVGTVEELEIAAANAVCDLIDYVPNLEIGSVDYEGEYQTRLPNLFTD